jgi:hypothetical protein
MKTHKLLFTACAVLLLPGCLAIGGRSETTPPTLGKQLTDLKAAYDHGAVTEQEFEQAKAQLIIGSSPKPAR